MRALVQRVKEASVWVGGTRVSAIDVGLLVLVGIARQDQEADAAWLAEKVARLRIFEDSSGKMSQDVTVMDGSILVVSQFTLYGTVRKGRRPDFTEAAPGTTARPLYEHFVHVCRSHWDRVETGVFGQDMDVKLVNWGPVTLWLESPR